jgi:hypothetical protein
MKRLNMRKVSWFAVTVAVLLGVGMMSLGGVFVAMGWQAKDDIRAALIKENVITSQDAPIPGVLVQDAETAKAQQDAIESHTFGRWGPYSGLARDDPNRQTYLNGLTLRNSLNLAVVGFGVADLAIGTGGIAIILGFIITALAIPVHIVVLRTHRQPVAQKVELAPREAAAS